MLGKDAAQNTVYRQIFDAAQKYTVSSQIFDEAQKLIILCQHRAIKTGSNGNTRNIP